MRPLLWFRDAPISRKLNVIGLLTSALALAAVSVVLIARDAIEWHDRALSGLTTDARVIGSNAAAAILFDDPQAAAETLSALAAKPDIVHAVIADSGGREFARYQAEGHPVHPAPVVPAGGHLFTRDRLVVAAPVVVKGETVGTVYLESDLAGFYNGILRSAGLTLLAALGVFLLVLVLFAALRKTIVGPILGLVGVMSRVSANQDYGLRAAVAGRDEIGTLARSFNTMIEGIQARDAELAGHREHLSREVDRRTEQLREANTRLGKELADRRQAEQLLRESEDKYRSIFESAKDIIFLLDLDGRFSSLSPMFMRVTGWPTEEWIGRTFAPIVHPDDLPRAMAIFRRAQKGEGTAAFDLRVARKSGDYFDAELNLTPLGGATVSGMVGIARDVSDRRRAELAQKRLNRALRMLSGCNSALVHASDETALLDEICKLIVDLGAYRMAWVAFALQDAAKSVACVACAGADDGYTDRLRTSWADVDEGRGPVGTAIREQRPMVVHDVNTEPAFALWRDEAVKRGYASVVAVPLRSGGKILGALCIYAGVPHAFDVEEVRLLEELADDLGYGILSLRETRARERFERELEYQANYDALTGLPNRALFQDRLARDLIYAGRDHRVVAVLSVDVDRFQAVNDSFDHATGDALLRQLGQALAACLRDGDTLARLSGDEFAISLNDVATEDDIPMIVRRLQAAVRQPVSVVGRSIPVSISIGISLFPKDGDDADALLKTAGAALHSAKSLGGNTFRYYAPDLNMRMSARFALEADLRRAIEQRELRVHYQPKVSLVTGRITGAEALVRWQHPDRGLVPPSDFIPLAEASGLIQPIGEQVLEMVCAQLRGWSDAGFEVPPVAVNLSVQQFRDENLVKLVDETLRRHGVAAGTLELEITESTLMGDMAGAVAILGDLRALGVKLALDDFGTGYSSLAYLKRLPVTSLKIDRAFVADLTTDPDDAAICLAIIDLAHNLRLQVVAEGVETDGQMNYLRRHHCDQMQGYLFSRPVPPDAFQQLLVAGRKLELPRRETSMPTVLLVDDEPNVLSALKRTLRPDGYRIHTAESGPAALELLAGHPVDVILCDQRMPDMNGTEFFERVRSLYPDTIRIILSSYTDLQTITDAINRGSIYKFLTKPWDPDQLRSQVHEALRHHQLAASAPG